jgi:hypothetical protein
MSRTLSRTRTAGDADDYTPDQNTEESVSTPKRVDVARPPRGGWEAFDTRVASRETQGDGKFPERLDLSETSVLIKFLDEKPLQVWEEHWIEDAVGIRFPGAEKPNKRKSFVCPTSLNETDSCALCDELGDRPGVLVAFNVVTFDVDKDEWVLKVLAGRTRVGKAVKALTEGRTTKPINKPGLYFDANKTGKGSDTTPHFERVMQDELEQDAEGPQPLTEEQIGEFVAKRWDRYAYRAKSDELAAIVAALSE